MRFRGVHAPCGTEVEDELPDGYPLEEGVGLFCPACREAFWSAGRPPATPEPRTRIWPVLLTGALLLGLAGLAASLLTGEDPAPAPVPQATATPAATPAPTPPPPVRVALGARTAELDVPEGWIATANGASTGDGTARITITSAPRRRRTLRRLGVLAARRVRAEGARPTRPIRVGVGDRSAMRLQARGGGLPDRELTILAAGEARILVTVETDDGAPPATREQALAAARTLRIV